MARLAEGRDGASGVLSVGEGETAGAFPVEETVIERPDVEGPSGGSEQPLKAAAVDHVAREVTELAPDPGEVGGEPLGGWAGGESAKLPVLVALEDVGDSSEAALGLDLGRET